MKIHLKTTTSTMDVARILIEKGVESGTVVYADYQENGRGRIDGRKWISNPNESLLATFIFKTEDIGFQITSFPLFAGYIVASIIKSEYSIDCKVKWPNDVLAGESKLCGIYTDCIDSYISCGIGINLNQTEFMQNHHRLPCSIRSITGKNADRDFILDLLISEFDKNIRENRWFSKFQNLLYRKGEVISVLEGLADCGNRIDGILEGIGEYGQMLIREANGNIREIFTAEIL